MSQLYFALAIVACFVIGEVLIRMRMPPEPSRKFVHVTACLMIAAHGLFGLSVREVAPVAAVFTVALATTRHFKLLSAISSVDRDSWGEVFMPLAVLVLALLDIPAPHFAVTFLIVGIADAAASLVGQRVRSRPYVLLRARKSVAGSLAFVVCAWLVLSLSFSNGLWPADAATAVSLGIVALLLMLGEGASSKGSDNLVVPLASAALLTLISSDWWPMDLQVQHPVWLARWTQQATASIR
jgi:dolichol kinase